MSTITLPAPTAATLISAVAPTTPFRRDVDTVDDAVDGEPFRPGCAADDAEFAVRLAEIGAMLAELDIDVDA